MSVVTLCDRFSSCGFAARSVVAVVSLPAVHLRCLGAFHVSDEGENYVSTKVIYDLCLAIMALAALIALLITTFIGGMSPPFSSLNIVGVGVLLFNHHLHQSDHVSFADPAGAMEHFWSCRLLALGALWSYGAFY